MFAKLPLTALRGFESAARLGSFKAAAQELNVSPAAISHQVKSLEAFLGVRLFERSSQSVRLSADGERLQPFMHRALLDIQHGLQVLSPPCAAQSLVVSTTPAFASLWLIPRLGDFHRLYPEIDVRLHTSNDVVDLQRDASIDLAIRALFMPDPQLFEQPLLDEVLWRVLPSRLATARSGLVHRTDRRAVAEQCKGGGRLACMVRQSQDPGLAGERAFSTL